MADEQNHGNRGLDPDVLGRLSATARRRGKLLKQRDKALGAAEAENKRLAEENKRLTDDNKRLAESADAKTVSDLRKEIRTRDHRAAFDRKARDAGAPEDALDVLWGQAGVKCEADTVDEEAIVKALDGVKAHPALSRLFTPALGEGSEAEVMALDYAAGRAQALNPNRPGPGSGRGQGPGTDGVTPRVSDALLQNDPGWVMRNYDKVVAAAKANVAARK
jgi:hypothetical protein